MPKCNRCYHRVATPGWICIMYDCDIFGDKAWKKPSCDCYLEDIDQSKRLDRDMINQMIVSSLTIPKAIFIEVINFRKKYNEEYLQEKTLCIQLMKYKFNRVKIMKEW